MTLPGHHLVTVYEAYNETLREVYLGATDLLVPRLVAGFRRHPPRAIAGRWRAHHAVHLRALIYAISADQAVRVIEKLARLTAARGRVIYDKPGRSISAGAP